MINEYNTFLIHIDQSVQAALERVLKVDAVLASEDRNSAWHILSFALDAPTIWPHTQKLLLALAPRMEQEAFRSEWIPYMQKGVQQSQTLQDIQTEADLSLLLGHLYLLSGEFELASGLLEKSSAIFERGSNAIGHAQALNRLAFCSCQQSQYSAALQSAKQALTLLDPTDPECANSFVVQGDVAFARGEWSEAEQFCRAALQLWEQANDRRKIIWGLRNLGPALRRQQKYGEAVACYERAIDLLQETHDPIALATVKMNLGALYYDRQQYEQALSLYLFAESIFRRAEDQVHLARIYNNIGMNHSALQEWAQAIEAFEKSITHWQQVGNLRSMCNAMDNLGEVYLEQRQKEQAISIFEQALALLNPIKDRPSIINLYTTVNQHLYQAIQME